MKRILKLSLIAISLFVNISNAYALTQTDVPIINSGAETGDMTGWAYVGSMSADNFEPQSLQLINPHSGMWFFSAAQPTGTLAIMNQSMDVSGFSLYIDAGLVLYDFRFWYQNENWDNAWDTGEGRITFYDNAMISLHSYSTGEIANDVWTLAEHQDYIPLNTRTIELNFTSRRYSGSHINAFYDDISLRVGVNQEPIVPEPASMFLFCIGGVSLVLFRRKYS